MEQKTGKGRRWAECQEWIAEWRRGRRGGRVRSSGSIGWRGTCRRGRGRCILPRGGDEERKRSSGRLKVRVGRGGGG